MKINNKSILEYSPKQLGVIGEKLTKPQLLEGITLFFKNLENKDIQYWEEKNSQLSIVSKEEVEKATEIMRNKLLIPFLTKEEYIRCLVVIAQAYQLEQKEK